MGKKLEKRSIPANILIYLILILLAVSYPVSYTHLTLPTNREV